MKKKQRKRTKVLLVRKTKADYSDFNSNLLGGEYYEIILAALLSLASIY